MNFTDLGLDQLFSGGDDTSPLMMLVWILPIILFVFYGQQIQLLVTSREIKKAIKKLEGFGAESREGLLRHAAGLLGRDAPAGEIDRFIGHFTIMPVDMDPTGIVEKVQHTVRSREDYTRRHVGEMFPDAGEVELTRIQTLLEVASSLQMIHRVVRHMFLMAKKQNNYPLILPLQMILPTVMEQAESLRDSVSAFRAGQPVGDGIGPMVVAKMMLGCEKETPALHTSLARADFEERRLFLVKAEGPGSTVGRPADALEKIVADSKLDVIIMVDAALKLEGEDSATISEGFGAAIGGTGTERFRIEEVAAANKIPVFSIVVRQSVREAVTLMTREIAQTADGVRAQVYEMIRKNTPAGGSAAVIGVGNTAGVPQ